MCTHPLENLYLWSDVVHECNLNDLISSEVGVPLAEHFHVCLEVDDQPDKPVDLVGRDSHGARHELVRNGLATVSTSQAANLKIVLN